MGKQKNDKLSLQVAIHGGQIIGAIRTHEYTGAEYYHPHGFKELMDQGRTFEVVELIASCEEFAQDLVNKHKP